MDGRSRFNKIKAILEEIDDEVKTLNQLKYLVMMNIGTSESLVRETLQFMIDLGMITEIEHCVFRINK